MKNSRVCLSVSMLLLLIAGSLPCGSAFAANYSLKVDGKQKLGTIPHFWSKCVGSGTMEYCLKPAWQQAAKIGAEEAGFEYVRGHGILIHLNNEDNINSLSWNGTGSTPTYNWSKIDQIYQAVLDCGLKPIVELSFMPKPLQSNTAASKPKDWTVWEDYIYELVKHLEEHFGVEEVRSWYFEVWNEYDYEGFWKDTPQDYYELYKRAAAGVKRADEQLPVGGPASTNPWPINDFLAYCTSNNVPVDFVSNHLYGGPGGDTAYAVNIRNDNRDRSTHIKNSGKKLLSFNTEFNSTYSGQGGYEAAANCVSMDSHKNAPFVAKVVKLIIDDFTSGLYPLPDVLSYWAISDCFDEYWGNNGNSYIEASNGLPFGQVFGLINYQGVRKATFNAYRLMHMMGTTGLKFTGGTGEQDGVDGFALLNEDSTQVAVMVYNYYFNLSNTGSADNVTLETTLPFAPNQGITMRHYRIDETHSNPYGVWVRLGKKTSPSTAEWDSIKAHEKLEELEPESVVQFDGSPVTKTFSMPRWSVSMLTFTRDATATDPAAAVKAVPVKSDALALSGAKLTVRSDLKGPLSVSVYSAGGRLIKKVTTRERSIHLDNGLSRGMYLVAAEVNGARMVQLMLISR